MNSEIYLIAWDQVKPDTLDLLNSGEARIINGVARNISDKYKIVQHMPFKKVAYSETTDLLKGAQSIQNLQGIVTSAIALSTVSIMGAIVISTHYLSKKLGVIQEKIDMLQKELESQNILYYTNKISTYFGSIEATREIINDKDVIEENKDLIIIKLSELATLRNELFYFFNNLIFQSDNFAPRHKAKAVDFINMAFNLLPKGIFIESQAAYKIERFHLGDKIRKMGQLKYANSIECYRGWANQQLRAIISGRPDSNTRVLKEKFEDINALISSEENKLILEHSL